MAGWKLPSYNDSFWGGTKPAQLPNIWNGKPVSLIQEKAEEIWHSSDCERNLDSSWFRLHIIVE